MQSNPGSGTVHAQQQCLLTMKGKPDAKVRKDWDEGTVSIVKQWKNEKAEIVLMMDANEGLEERALRELISTAGMYDLMGKNTGAKPPIPISTGQEK
eukprot:6326844-Ditylum_brightwellii.AAC.2